MTSTTPIRGTQSFVGVMSEVWRRPSLTLLEVFWRWLVGGLLLLTLIPRVLQTAGILDIASQAITVSPALTGALQAISVFQPVAAVHTLQALFATLLAPNLPLLRWVLAAVFVTWNITAALGRTLVLRRLDTALHSRTSTLFLLGTLRALLLAAAWLVWFKGLAWAARTAILAPAAHAQEPSVVLFAALLICGTLVLYVAWGIVSWPFYLAPLLAMRNDLGTLAALRTAVTSSRALCGKLIEINLVMNIVRLCLIVLAMVLSASPLAFQSVATQQFFVLWWSFAVLLYLAASDFFHVVRSAAYLTLHRALTPG